MINANDNVSTDSKKIVSIFPNKINYGRKRILVDYDEVTPDNVIEVLQKALNVHASNRHDCEYLINYFLGDQDILYRPSPTTSNINNRTVVNYAFPITREVVGYTLGSPVELVAKDIVSARSMLPDDFTATDPQRVARALEVFFETGRHLTEFQNMPRIGAVAPNAKRILICPDSGLLRERIAARIPQMLSGGAMDEAHLVIKSGWDETRAIGASQLCRFIRGEISETECIENWITKTNQYAKRQRTWFRTQYKPDIIINRAGTDADIDEIITD